MYSIGDWGAVVVMSTEYHNTFTIMYCAFLIEMCALLGVERAPKMDILPEACRLD